MKILIIEDNISVRNVLRIGLEAEGYIIDDVSDGDRGSYFARINKYNLIILDNVLPKKMGNQVCREIRNAGVTTPVLLLSAKSDVNSKIELLETGADDYMIKPFSFEELKSRIKALCRRPEAIKNKVVKVGNLEINSESCEIRKNNKRIYLTRKEFSLLNLLIENIGQVVSRGMIMELVWESNINPFSNTIEAHIRNIRTKIGDPQKKIIQNIPGRGYKINNFFRKK
ncbi:response regulator transcription factor [Candidatus Parcubacteria bacterium]|nr:response regulator transcription factor [Candidatus Parcubacteria bacterium]